MGKVTRRNASEQEPVPRVEKEEKDKEGPKPSLRKGLRPSQGGANWGGLVKEGRK